MEHPFLLLAIACTSLRNTFCSRGSWRGWAHNGRRARKRFKQTNIWIDIVSGNKYLYILGNNIQIYIRFLIYHYHLVYVDWWCFGQQICWAFPKMSEFKAHPVKAFFRVWVYLLILANPLQRRDGKHRESLVHTQHSRGKLNRRKLPDKSWQQGVCHWALELETLNTKH